VHLTVVDNSPAPDLDSTLDDLPRAYHFYGENVGYGRGHNWAIFNAPGSKYHLILNPDVTIPPQTINLLVTFMEKNPDVGLVCPKVLNNDGSTQFLNKRYPTLFDLFLRRFVPKSFHHLTQHRLDQYEMRDIVYDNICYVECISGCFMFCRTEVLKSVGGFDDRYFMFFEDFDLSRKIQESGYRTVYYPHATVTHLWERASHKSLKMTMVHIQSAFKYFNKWGWLFY
jgi:GT2 family glycosyltransferase